MYLGKKIKDLFPSPYCKEDFFLITEEVIVFLKISVLQKEYVENGCLEKFPLLHDWMQKLINKTLCAMCKNIGKKSPGHKII